MPIGIAIPVNRVSLACDSVLRPYEPHGFVGAVREPPAMQQSEMHPSDSILIDVLNVLWIPRHEFVIGAKAPADPVYLCALGYGSACAWGLGYLYLLALASAEPG